MRVSGAPTLNHTHAAIRRAPPSIETVCVATNLASGRQTGMNWTMSPPAHSNAVPRRISGALIGILILMVASVAINYVDRTSLSTAAPLLGVELSIPPAKMGMLLSAFFWTYAFLQLVAGWLVDRHGVRWVMAIGFFIWSAATIATGLAPGFATLLWLRLLLGAGESVAYPCYSKIIAGNFAEHQRGLANSLIDAGTKFGPALGIFAGGILMGRYGWRPVFIVLGLGSLLWLPPWFKWMPSGHAAAQTTQDSGPGFAEICSQRQAWATIMGHFSGNYLWYFLITWLPSYLVKERGFSMTAMASAGAMAFCLTGITTISTGALADRAIAAGATPTRVRKTCVIMGLGLATSVVAVAVVHGSAASMACLMFACIAYGVFASSHWAIPQTIAGPVAAGKWTGLQNCLANFAGVAAPAITGFVVERTGHFFWAFAVCSAVVLVGAAAYAFLMGPVEPVQWSARTP
jgi:ACS family D-galactonate transporter-like MFS transporter